MKKRTMVAITACAVGAILIGWNALRTKPIQVAMTSVERGDVRHSVSNTRAGTVDACQRARLAPTLGGQIAELPVSEGDRVEPGQILLQLWNDDLRAQLHLAEEEYQASTSRQAEACTVADVARREARRINRLLERGLTSEESADIAKGEAQARAASCKAAQSMVEVSAAQIELVQARLEQTIVRAPFGGTIAEINGELGEFVTPSPVGIATLPAIDLIDASCIYITAPIDEVDAPNIRAGMKATITLDAYPDQQFPATVTRVAPYVLDIAKQARTVDIEAEFDEPFAGLLPGYSADVEVMLDVHEQVLRIPTQAVLGNERVLVIAEDGILEERLIRPGLRNWQFTEIVEGLSENDRVVLSVDRPGVVAGAAVAAEAG